MIMAESIFCSFNRKRRVPGGTITRCDSTTIGRRQLVENVRLEEVFEERAGEKKKKEFDAHGDTWEMQVTATLPRDNLGH